MSVEVRIFDPPEAETPTFRSAGRATAARQSERKRVVFDLERKTAQSRSCAGHTSDSRNLFYATMAGSEFADETLTVTYIREGEAEPVGMRDAIVEPHIEVVSDG